MPSMDCICESTSCSDLIPDHLAKNVIVGIFTSWVLAALDMFIHLRSTRVCRIGRTFSGSRAICIISIPRPSSPARDTATVSIALSVSFLSSAAARTGSLNSSGNTEADGTGFSGVDLYTSPSAVSSIASSSFSEMGAANSLSVASINSKRALFSKLPSLPLPIPKTLATACTKSLNADTTLFIGLSTPFNPRRKPCILSSVSA